jgi:glucose-6-phosphate-specific signal transduction histidine kinase
MDRRTTGVVTRLFVPSGVVRAAADDGRGFDPSATARGSGLQNMSDRPEAIGGSLTFRSEPGSGTTISGRIAVGEVATG